MAEQPYSKPEHWKTNWENTNAELAKARARIAAVETEHGKELGRWQEAVRDWFIDKGVSPDNIDGGGGESGDPLDLTLEEIGQGVDYLREADAERLAELGAAIGPAYFEGWSKGRSAGIQCALEGRDGGPEAQRNAWQHSKAKAARDAAGKEPQ
jgi:hypothetical protein